MSLSDILVFEHMAPFTWKGIATAIASEGRKRRADSNEP
ncbi:MAG: hypothetical protein AWU56_1920 [Idiomarina sp. T82-3]|nr:MAG: hypothetical protein AWU56_1920 [Idiomarina sp. T82-3]|tara:strand:- start:98 stop:214 length:117 start_codon:yes stop_codon:yes gene_type:complete